MDRLEIPGANRRTYNQWVANETMEDFALRFTARRARKWSAGRVANTAIGSISFLALEAIGGALTLSYGVENAVAAILVVGLLLFLTALPISYYAATAGVDIDLLTRGAGFGYLGSTITSLIYASFTFIFFALEAAILSLALELCFGIPLEIGYLLNALVVIPLVTHGFTRIGAFQKWTQPIWLALQILPFLFLLVSATSLGPWLSHEGRLGDGELDLLLFAVASGVVFSLAAQIGEQVDFLRFLPEPKTPRERLKWWAALIAAGPGWAVIGTLKMLAGSFLAVLALGAGVAAEHAVEPTQMYLAAFSSALPWEMVALTVTGLFVIICQLKINVTNAYAGSIAWSNFFSRLTHSHPGRVVWLVFNVLIALMLMEFGVFGALENTLGLYAHVAVAWVGALVADLVINKPLGLSPKRIEFRRGYLYDINPVGTGAMTLAVMVSFAAYLGAFGALGQAMSSFIALGTALVAAPLIAWATGGRYYLARIPDPNLSAGACSLCEHSFDAEDMVDCPFHQATICSLCCTLDANCGDRCKPPETAITGPLRWLRRRLGFGGEGWPTWQSRYGLYLGIWASFLVVIGAAMLLIHQQVSLTHPDGAAILERGLLMTFTMLALVVGVGAWLHVLAVESRVRALREGERQTERLVAEIAAHERTDAELQKAKEDAEAANEAKSRYVVGISHELRTPLNAILGYAQLMEGDPTVPKHRRAGVEVIRRSAEHLGGLIEGLLDISRIEAGRLEVYRDEIRLRECLEHIAAVFHMQAREKRLEFEVALPERLPDIVHGDEKRLRQILMNLLANAVRYTDEGRVRFEVAYASETATFTVSDTGRGIPGVERERIFQPFERIEDPRAPVPGTGLGLTITKLLTEMLGGELTLDSTPGEGSTFRVRLMLPRGRSHRETARDIRRPIRSYEGARKQILVIDDNAEHRSLVADILRPLGFRLAFAETGEAAEAVLAGFAPDLILLDVAMPGVDGWTLLSRLRHDLGVTAPVFMVSAHAFDKRLEGGGATLHDDFVTKPIRIDDLLDRIGRHLGLVWSEEVPAATVPGIRRPPASALGPLRAAIGINHAAGVAAALDALEAADPRWGPFVAEGRALLTAYDFGGLGQFAGAGEVAT
ncbi:MAG: ATP-binding protein [Pseudomonadota bacterium]